MSQNYVCTTCFEPVAESAIDLEWKVGRCKACKTLFDVTPQLGPDSGAVPVAATKGTYSGSVVITEQDGEFLLVHDWSNVRHLLQLIGFLVMSGGFAFYQVVIAHHPGVLGFVLALFVPIFYVLVARVTNKTRIRLTGDRMEIAHGPLPWPGKSLSLFGLSQFYVQEVMTRKGRRVYRLMAEVNGSQLAILPQFPEPDDLKYIERALESHLRIENRDMPQEA